MMSSQNRKNLRELSSQEKPKDDYIHIRVNSDIKAILKRFAERDDKSLSGFILDSLVSVITEKETVMTNPKERDDKSKTALKQLIDLFDKIFDLKFEDSTLDKILSYLEEIDMDLIEQMREEIV